MENTKRSSGSAAAAIFQLPESELARFSVSDVESEGTPTRPHRGRRGTSARKTGQGAKPDSGRLQALIAQTFDAADVAMPESDDVN